MEFFNNCSCIEELKETYRELCFKYHPDVSKEENAVETMKQINTQYDEIFKQLKNVFKNSKGEVYKDKKPVSETPEEFRNIMSMLVNMEGIIVELIGRWIWITGNTKSYKKELTKLKFRWCKNKKAWSWHRPEDHTRSQGKTTLNEIRTKYGSVKVEKDKKMPPNCYDQWTATQQQIINQQKLKYRQLHVYYITTASKLKGEFLCKKI